MTNQNKFIVGAVVVLGAYYLYDRNKKMNTVSDLKKGAEVPLPPSTTTIQPMTSVPLIAMDVRPESLQLEQEVGRKFSNFAGSRGNSMSAQYFR
jgi:hypothetical protein